MLKKLREKLYDRRMKKHLESIKFDTFMYYSDSMLPAFVTKQGKGEVYYSVFFPKTEGTFKMAFGKLKNNYFKKVPYVVAKDNIKTYCQYYNFSEKLFTECMEMYQNKKSLLYAAKKSNNEQ